MRPRKGILALKFARRRAQRRNELELAQQITDILADDDMRALAVQSLEDEATEVGLLEKILRWIVENPEQFKDLIEFIIGLFADMATPE